MTRRVLMVSWLFPPHSSIGARRAWRFAKYLPAEGWLPTVLCRRRVPPSNVDASDWSLPSEVTLLPEYDAEVFSQVADAWLTRASTSTKSPAVKRDAPAGLLRGWRDRLQERWDGFVDAVVPTETAVIHAPHAAKVIEREAARHDLVWTTSYPYHSHLLGLRAAKKHGKPFVADLRDPWTPNWVHRRKFPHARAVEAWGERAVFDGADAIVVTTEALAELYRAMFPEHAQKFVTIHNVFDPAPAEAPVARSDARPLLFVHFGNVYGPWSFETLFRAIARLRVAGAFRGREVVVENYGKLSDRDRARAVELGVDDLIRVCAPLPYERGLARLREADLLLLAAWDDPDARLYIQGKLYDYLCVGRDVLAETGQAEITGIIEKTGAGAVVRPGEVGAMCEAIERVVRGERVTTRPWDEDAVRYWSAPDATRRLAALFDQLTRRPV